MTATTAPGARRRTIRARNTAPDSENLIHRDDVARRHGFKGGLVPGITTYAYLARPVAEALGAAWLSHGSMSVRLTAPVYDGDEIEVSAVPDPTAADRWLLEATNAQGVVCATGSASPVAGGEPPAVRDYPAAVLPATRPAASAAVLGAIDALGSVRRTFRMARAPEFLAGIDDDLPLWQSVAHPGWIVYDTNQALARNVTLGPWVHVGSEVRHYSAVADGDVVETRGRVARVFDRKGHGMVELDLLMVAAPDETPRPVWHVRHTAIYRLSEAERDGAGE